MADNQKTLVQERLSTVYDELLKTADRARDQGHYQESSLSLQLASQIAVTARFLEDHSHGGGGPRWSILGMEDEDGNSERAAW